jgi:hypothetical protein
MPIYPPSSLIIPRRKSGGGGGGISVLFETVAGGGAGSGTSAAGDTTGCDLIVLVHTCYAFLGAPTDNMGNTYIARTPQDPLGNNRVCIYECAAPIVGPGHTFTHPGQYGLMRILGCSGARVSPFESENGATTASATTLAAGSVTPTINGSLIVAGLANYTGAGSSIGGGLTYTNYDFVGGNNIATGAGWLVQALAAAINPAWSWPAANEGAAVIAVYKPA